MHTTTSSYPIHTLETAPAGARPSLERLRSAVGMIPNLAGAMAGAPALIEAFVATRDAFHRSSLSLLERETLALANASENGCRYCTAIHATFALKAGLAPAEVERVRSKVSPEDARLAALVGLTRSMIQQRGKPTANALQDFFAAGFTPEQVLEVVLGLGMSTMANYSGHVTHVAPDEILRLQYR